MGGDAAELVDNPLVNPTDEFLATLSIFGPLEPGRGGEVRQAVRGDHRLRLSARWPSGTTRDASGHAWSPWLLLGPGLLFLFLFFFFPLYTLFRMSLSASPTRFADPVFDWQWDNYSTPRSPSYGDQFFRSFEYAALATLLALVIAYPLAYVIAFRGGRYKNLLLGLVVVPFFTNFLIRTLAWKTILGDQGIVVGLLPRRRHPRPERHAPAHAARPSSAGSPTTSCRSWCCRSTSRSRRSTRGSIDAARDLYSNTWRAFRKVVFPLSLPGVFAGQPARVHPGRRRLRERVLPRQREDHDDRQRRAEPVPRAGRTTRSRPRSRSCSWPS